MGQGAAQLGRGAYVRWRLKTFDPVLGGESGGVGTIVSIDAATVVIDSYDAAAGRPRRLPFKLDDVDLQLEGPG